MKHSNIVHNHKELLPYIADILKFYDENNINIKPYPKVKFSKTKEYDKDVFGRTAWYDPEDKSVTLITYGRHPKDILRSFAHELVHHNQNLDGIFDSSHLHNLTDPQYAEHDKHLRRMEMDAYLRGNMLFRSWEDRNKIKYHTHQ